MTMPRQMIQLIVIICWAIVGTSCDNQSTKSQPESSYGPATIQAEVPSEVKAAIEKEFPGTKPYSIAIDTLLQHLKRYGITSDQILLGQSTCVDDITSTKNKLIHPEIKGPFSFGGLAGLPFTGITGINAFSHHVPEHGTALLLVGPHIGYNATAGWGQILRHGQEHTSTCCGALYAALEKLKKNEIKAGAPTEDDYQEQVIEQLALLHKDEIIKAPEQLVALTRGISNEAERKITNYASRVKERHFDYAVVVVGVIINTDYAYDDYLWIDHIAIKDIQKDAWIEGAPIQESR